MYSTMNYTCKGGAYDKTVGCVERGGRRRRDEGERGRGGEKEGVRRRQGEREREGKGRREERGGEKETERKRIHYLADAVFAFPFPLDDLSVSFPFPFGSEITDFPFFFLPWLPTSLSDVSTSASL